MLACRHANVEIFMTTCILIYSCTICSHFMCGKELGYTDCSLAITYSQMEQPLSYRHTKKQILVKWV